VWKWRSGDESSMAGKSATPRLDELHGILFLAARSTGLQTTDRITGLGMIGLDRASGSDFSGQSIHLVFGQTRSAERLEKCSKDHEPFGVYAEALADQFRRADLIVSHNADFDIRLLNLEMKLASLAPINVPTFCTLTAWRNAFPGTRSSWTAIADSLRRPRSPGLTQDAWLTALIFFKLCGATLNLELEDITKFPADDS
jgi:hypothetical protein